MKFVDTRFRGRPHGGLYVCLAAAALVAGFIFEGFGLRGAMIFNLLLLFVLYGLAIATGLKRQLHKQKN